MPKVTVGACLQCHIDGREIEIKTRRIIEISSKCSEKDNFTVSFNLSRSYSIGDITSFVN